MKALNFANWSNGEKSKSIFYVKNHPNLSAFFSLKYMYLGAHFLITSDFKSLNLLK